MVPSSTFILVVAVGILLLPRTVAAFTIRITTLRPIVKIQQWSRILPLHCDTWRTISCPTRRASSLRATNPATPATSTALKSPMSALSFIDIGANLLDERFTLGIYNGKPRHEPDWDAILQRAQQVGVKAIVVTAGTLAESRKALELVRSLRQKQQQEQQQQQQQQQQQEGSNPSTSSSSSSSIRFGCTIGIHPTRCQQEFLENGQQLSPEEVLMQLRDLALDGQRDHSVVAWGEMGLDYDRLEFGSQATQRHYFQQQLQILVSHADLDPLPLFLHNRNVGTDLLQVLQEVEGQEQPQDDASSSSSERRRRRLGHGVVHSFDDSLELALQFIDWGFYIGINGCSLKTQENLKVVEQLPLDKILLETDCPYCEIKNTHAGTQYIQTTWGKKMDKKFEWGKMVKGRNEPCQIIQVAEVIAGVKKLSLQEVAHTCYQNSLQFYGWQDRMEESSLTGGDTSS